MKRIFAIALLCVVALLSSPQANAMKYGVIGGAAFPGKGSTDSQTVWSAGGTVQMKLPLGFSVQPSLVCSFGSQNSLNLPVSLQWGPDLLLLRPFLDVAPYVGYGFSGHGDVRYGVGVGGGLDIWRLQVSCRYNWGLEDSVSNYRGTILTVAFLFGK